MDIDIFYGIMGQNNYQGNSQTTFTPDNIAKEMIDSLPDTVWNDKQAFLDISCKTGVFLKHIYNKLDIALAKLNDYKDPIKRREHILMNQIYALCIDNDFQLLQTQRNLYGCIGRYNNIAYMENYSKLIKERDNTRFKNRLQELFNRMTFNVVVGNPPYNRGGDIDFVFKAFEIQTDFVTMITPAKWQTAEADQKIASEHSYGEFREKLVPHMREVVFYPDCGNVFAISQVDGICYYIIDRQKHENCIVKNKCIHQKYYNSVENRNITHQQTLVNIGNEIIEYLGKYSPYKIEQPNRYKRYQVWTNNQLTIGGQGGQVNYLLSVEGMHNAISISRIIDSNDLVDMKCRTGASSCSFSSDSKEECEYFISWLNTRFNRFFIAINISKLTGVLTNHCFRFVPAPMVLDEHGNRIPGKFDHVYTDQELYKTWNLPQKYIDVIEAIVKERK